MDAETNPGELRERAVSGLVWSVSTAGVRQAIGLVTGVALARLLFPSDFGLVAMIQVFTGVSAILFEIGIAGALVQATSIRREECDSIFVLNILLGTTLTALFAILSEPIALFYSEPRLHPIALVMALLFVLDAAGSVPRVLLIRDLNFKKLGQLEIVSVFITNAATVTAAALGAGLWSLVLQALLGSFLATALEWKAVKWRPRLQFQWHTAKRLIEFGSTFAGSRLLAYSARNLDIMFVGIWLGSTEVGYFNFAYRVMVFPVWSIVGVFSRVMFSLLSRIQTETERVGTIYVRVAGLISVAIFPVMIGIMVVAEPFVTAVLGPRWLPMIPVLRILCIVGMVDSVTASTAQLYFSQGQANLHLRVNVALRMLSTTGVFIGLYWGLTGAATGMAIAALLGLLPALRFPCRMIQLPIRRVARPILSALACSVGMGLPVWWVGRLLLDMQFSSRVILGGQALLGAGFYAALVWIANPGSFRENLRLFVQTAAGRLFRNQ